MPATMRVSGVAGVVRQDGPASFEQERRPVRNNALWTIAMVRMRSDPRTRAYVERQTKEGMSRKQIHRCLKRYFVRELYPLILADLADSTLAT